MESQENRHQNKVNVYFDGQTSYWSDIYSRRDVLGAIYQDRHETVLDWVDRLPLLQDSRVLEIGCGAGFLSIALAERGFLVEAIDASEEMVQRARQQVNAGGNTGRVSVSSGDVNALSFPDATFDMVLAVGVIPWVASPGRAIAEMSRVVRPGGWVILTADNRFRLNHLLDPRLSPLFSPLKGWLRSLVCRLRRGSAFRELPPGKFHSPRIIDSAVRDANLETMRSTTIGFGPFTLLGHRVLSDTVGVDVHRRLQRLADAGLPGLRSTGAQYMVLANSPEAVEMVSSSAKQPATKTVDVRTL